ncbi:MAG: hypothetical protein BAA02_14165 [Paenibacillaceae bacterium ZCTH02-B3]|nr:MAG: hypothetical protein BAA02_14165 [Paenibacillaceae bacterium ZCTH02-B3]
MRRIAANVLLALAVLAAAASAGCAGRPGGPASESEPIPLTAVLGIGLDAVERIEIRFGDGRGLAVTDPETVRGIADRLKAVTVRVSEVKDVGYLYFLNLFQGDQTRRVGDRYTHLDGRTYETVDDDAGRALNAFVLGLGRERMPDLLPGLSEDDPG